jgi:hypothetical protein
MEPRARGRCLCGAVAYEVRGPLRDVVLCHCKECRRSSGYVGAFTATRLEHFALVEDRRLRWADSPRSDRRAKRGFCGECGSSLFWRPADGERIHVAAGTLDAPTGLAIAGHWYTNQAGDYDELLDDGRPRDSELSGIEIRWR